MRLPFVILAAAAAAVGSAAHAGSQSSNTSSNSSSNNGVVRERVVDTYCEDGWCERVVARRVYRDGSHRRDWRERNRHDRRYRGHRDDWRAERYGRDRRYANRGDRDDDDDD